MRTTITLDDDAESAIRAYSKIHNVSRGAAASELIRRGTQYRIPIKYMNGLAVFNVPPGFPVVTNSQVKQALEEE
jgi:hypothetical protein